MNFITVLDIDGSHTKQRRVYILLVLLRANEILEAWNIFWDKNNS